MSGNGEFGKGAQGSAELRARRWWSPARPKDWGISAL